MQVSAHAQAAGSVENVCWLVQVVEEGLVIEAGLLPYHFLPGGRIDRYQQTRLLKAVHQPQRQHGRGLQEHGRKPEERAGCDKVVTCRFDAGGMAQCWYFPDHFFAAWRLNQ